MSEKVGEIYFNKIGDKATIVKYINKDEVYVTFEGHDEYIKYRYQNLRKGEFKSPFTPSVYGVGYIGVGKYKPKENGKTTDAYKDWYCMLQRGYSELEKQKHNTYKDITVNSELFCFQDFCKWREQNYYEIDGETMELDKDILFKGNKEYSFNTMIYVPHRINSLFIKSDVIRGDLPIGVDCDKRRNKYRARCKIGNNKTKYLGYYNTPEEAFQAYKEFKEAYIKEVADEYKNVIPKRLYDAMYIWEVEITD